MSDDAKQAKAEAKAAKAKAKALRPWYKKKRFLALIAIAVIAIVSVASNQGRAPQVRQMPTASMHQPRRLSQIVKTQAVKNQK